MRLINAYVEPLVQESGLLGLYRHIERCARTCYKSEDRITDSSAEEFVRKLIDSGHLAMLEHGTVYLEDSPLLKGDYAGNMYSSYSGPIDKACITTNLRVIFENEWLDDLKYLCEPSKYHTERITFRIVTDRGVTHELVRHRKFSFAQESSRYCNYSFGKFNNEITCIIPEWLNIEEGRYTINPIRRDEDYKSPYNTDDYNTSIFIEGLCKVEKNYFELIEKGWTAQQARQILPTALKSEICMTGFLSDWEDFLNIRLKESTGKVHPNMKVISEMIQKHLF